MRLSPVELTELALFCLALVFFVFLELICPFLDLAWFRWSLLMPTHLIAWECRDSTHFVFAFIWKSITTVHTFLVLLFSLIYCWRFEWIHCDGWCISPIAWRIANQVIFVNKLLVELWSDWLVVENTLNTCLWFQTVCLRPIDHW